MSILRYLDFFLKIQIYSTGCPRKWCQFMCGEPFSPMAMFSGTPGVSVLDWGLSQSQGLLGYCNKANLSNVLELNVSYSLKDCHVYGCLKVKKNVHRWSQCSISCFKEGSGKSTDFGSKTRRRDCVEGVNGGLTCSGKN